jgi:hypothetical protein
VRFQTVFPVAATRKKEKKFLRLFNTISVIEQKIATAALDRPHTFAALTRAHAGLAELRPPRSHSKQSSKFGSVAVAVAVAVRAVAWRCTHFSSLRGAKRRSNPERRRRTGLLRFASQ